jgi:TolB-like protein
MALVGVAALVWGAWFVGKRAGASEAETDDTAAPASVTSPAAGGPSAAAPTGVQLAYADLSEDPRPSLAVLPFDDMSENKDQEYFSDGMTEEILNVLAKIPDLRVGARTTSFTYKGQDVDVRDVGRDLGVQYVLEGSVRKSGDQLRITAQLIDTEDNFHVWSESYDRTLDNVFEVQSEIAEAIADALKVPLGVDQPSDLVTPTADLAAYDLYLEGRARMRERGEGTLEAITLFEGAIARDSSWAPAWAGLAQAHELSGYHTRTEHRGDPVAWDAIWAEVLESTETAARRALELDPNSALARVALGSVYRARWQWEPAEAEYLKALAIDPDDVEAHQQYAELLMGVGRLDEGVRSASRALALDRNTVRLAVYSWVTFVAGLQEESTAAAREAIALDPDDNVDLAFQMYNGAMLRSGQYEEVQDGGIPLGEGRSEREIVVALQQGDPSLMPAQAASGLHIWALMLLDRPDLALDALAGFEPVRYGPEEWVFLQEFDSIRADPRFQAVMAQIGLEGVEPQRPSRPKTEAGDAAVDEASGP